MSDRQINGSDSISAFAKAFAQLIVAKGLAHRFAAGSAEGFVVLRRRSR